MLEISEYDQFDIELEPGDRVLSYTDALMESNDTNGEMLGEKGVLQILRLLGDMRSYNFVFVLTRGGPGNATMTFPMLAYEIGIDGARQLGTAAAVSVLFFPIFIVAIFVLTKRMLSSEARA